MCSKAVDIANVIYDIMAILPPDEDTIGLNNLKDSLFHTAPEICDNFWHKIFTYVSNRYNGSKGWHTDVCKIYNEGYEKYKTKYI